MISTCRIRHRLSAGLTLALLLAVLVPAGGPPARADGCFDSFHDSGIAWTGKSVVLVASNQGIDGGDLFYFWQKTGTSTWHREHVASGGCIGSGFQPLTELGYQANGIAWTGDSVIIAAVDQRNGGLYYWWQPNGGTTWHQETVASGPPGCCSFGSVVNSQVTPDVHGYSVPSIAWTGKSVVIAATDKHGLHYWFQEKFKTTWYHEFVSSDSIGAQPSIAWTGASVVIADLCKLALCYYWQSAGSKVWHHQVVDTASTGRPSIAWTGHAVVIAATQYPGDKLPGVVTYWWQAVGTAPWHKQQVSTARATPFADTDFASPSIAGAGGSVVIAAADTTTEAQQVDYWWEPAASNGTWTLQNPSGSAVYSGTTDPRSIGWTGVSVVLTATDACGDLDYWWQRVGTVAWNRQRIATNTSWPKGTC
jgi:hypothetical protein